MALAFAGKAVAGSAISTIVRKSFDYLEKHIKGEGMKSAKKRLGRTLPQVQVVFDAIDMERIRDQSEALDSWLWQLRDAVEEAEDVLDELEYYKLEKKVKGLGNKVSSSMYKCKRLFIQQFNATFKAGTFKRMLDAMNKLDEVAAGVDRFILLVDRLDSSSLRHIYHQDIVSHRETSSFLTEETIIGRDIEKDKLIDWLIEQGADNQNHEVCNVNLIALMGIGGMGKTTLAQAVYNDQRVKQCFDHAMWVCVSNDFDVPALTKRMVQESTRQGTDVTCLNTLQEILRSKLCSKKFLLVFDDVWNDERRPEWEKVVAPLKLGQKGSKILLTTRMRSVVDIAERVIGGRTKSMRLEGLPENDLLALFNKHAFFGVDLNNYVNLQEIGRQVTMNLNGSPLAAKVMGGLLNNCMDSIYWNRVLSENISSIEHCNEGVMKVLRLSYHHLPPYLQACFRYCSIFQEDHKFKKEELVDLWMGSGLIQQTVDENQRPEDVGAYYLDLLTRKSFFELGSHATIQWYHSGSNVGEVSDEYYVLHDLLHELARTVSKKECIVISGDDYGIIPETVRHASIRLQNHRLITDFFALKKLRTLRISFDRSMRQRDQWIFMKNVLKMARNLRVLLVIGGSMLKLPDALGNLMHLRYVCHHPWKEAGKYFIWFPCSVYKLYHLQILQLAKCLLLSWQLGNLVSLRQLYYDGYIIGPPLAGRLTAIQVWRHHARHRDGLLVSEIQGLKDIRYLEIHGIENVKVEEAILTKLHEKENLNLLSLTWQSGQTEEGSDERVLNGLQPHTNLTRLKIEGYNGSRSPCWMESPILNNVTFISLSKCHNWQHLPPFGELPSLKYLYLRHMNAVKKVNNSFYGLQNPFCFPSLKVLDIEYFPELDEWVEIEGSIPFPQLEALSIIECRALRNVPTLPYTLAYFELSDVGLTCFPATYRPSEITRLPSSLFKLEISRCPNLVTLDQDQYFSTLEELRITDCKNLLHLPMDRLQTLPFLKTLWLDRCPKLMAAQEDTSLPSSIRKLDINSCAVVETCLLNSIYSLTSLTTLQLHNCVMTALPSAEVFRKLATVLHLAIVHCRELVALDGIEGLSCLRELNVSGCDKIDRNFEVRSQQMFPDSNPNEHAPVCPSHFVNLAKLRISSPFLLQWDPLRRLNSVTNLTIVKCHRCLPEEWLVQNCSHLENLGVCDAAHLEFLPAVMASLTSLKTLELHRAVLIQSLPDLPASLEVLQILECHPMLDKRCQKRRGRDWHKIAYIPHLQIVQDRPSVYAYHFYSGFH